MYSDLTAVIVAGGKSSRMGREKALMRFKGRTMIEHSLTLLSPLFPMVAINTNRPDDFEFLGVPTFPDVFREAGPLGGIHAALTRMESPKVFILGCDIPLMTRDIIRTIVEFPSDRPIVIPHADGFLQPLCGVYAKGITDIIAHLIDKRENRDGATKRCGMFDLTRLVPTTVLTIEEECSTYRAGAFLNMNRPDEYQLLLQHEENNETPFNC